MEAFMVANLKVYPNQVITKGLGKLFIVDTINEWLDDSGISLKLKWDTEEAKLALQSPSAFGALGIQLLSTITTTNLAVCSGCSLPYLRKKRKPQPGRMNFCPNCQGKAANTLRQRVWRSNHPK
jgi:hypothetical protein